ncbi:aminotransferase class V-fold PLP-dependent enzyme [Roseicyclus sp. F158]|uniref:Aminotransferase class V-fold PLP-dependent enzyme n=1 Tax=Tropicimonas omnivorans TaxID=3075590 RepID=A0ABU3DD73_9RHOB|nr:aminotransferase class V-fold PLP-dependent enzyme [Roseicyclus sp. F158]MDT0681615.1 aminotransferase class V-fold PLP-dependent enzyme [Roseicyclus sp. F158]
MSGYFLYHSIGTFPGKDAALSAQLSEFSSRWSATDDGQWGYALEKQGEFLSAWAKIIGAAPGTLAQAESVTAALYTLIRGMPETRLKGGKVLIAKDCFPSLHFLLAEVVSRAGGELVTVEPAAGELWVSDAEMLAAWDKDVRLALLTWVTSTSSHKSDVKALVAHGHEMGSLVGVDVTQGVGIAPYDVSEVGADFTVGSSLKWLCGVSGAGVLHATPELIAETSPEFRGWFSQDNPFSWDLDAFSFAADARRFGNGTPNVLPAIGCLPGLSYVLDRGIADIARDNAAKVSRLAEGVRAAGLPLASPEDAAERGGSLMVQMPAGLEPGTAVEGLRAKGLHTDMRGRILRLSPGTVTGIEECDRMVAAISEMVGATASV